MPQKISIVNMPIAQNAEPEMRMRCHFHVMCVDQNLNDPPLETVSCLFERVQTRMERPLHAPGVCSR